MTNIVEFKNRKQKKEREDALKAFLSLLRKADAYLARAKELQEKYDFEKKEYKK